MSRLKNKSLFREGGQLCGEGEELSRGLGGVGRDWAKRKKRKNSWTQITMW